MEIENVADSKTRLPECLLSLTWARDKPAG